LVRQEQKIQARFCNHHLCATNIAHGSLLLLPGTLVLGHRV
jgi:hypothetical protein